MSFTKQELQSFRTDFAKAVAKLEKEYGVEIGLGNISYSAEQFTSKIKVAKTVSSNGQKTSMEEIEFGNLCARFGLTKKDYKRQINFNGKVFELTGFKPRSRNSLVATDISNGVSYKLPVSAIS